MVQKLTEADGRIALRDHVIEKALRAREKLGGRVDHAAMLRLLDDRDVVRWPVTVRFDVDGLQEGEFAHAQQRGEHPSAGFTLFVHPSYEHQPSLWPPLMAYHLARINYGDVAGTEECELFGATLLGLSVDDYYARLCNLADGAWLNRRALR